MRKDRILKLAEFVEKLPRRKLDMRVVGVLNGGKKLDPVRCRSAACAMGWATVVFPRDFQFHNDDLKGHITPKWRRPRSDDDSIVVISQFMGIPRSDAQVLFGIGKPGYRTPRQVAAGLRKYAETQELPGQL